MPRQKSIPLLNRPKIEPPRKGDHIANATLAGGAIGGLGAVMYNESRRADDHLALMRAQEAGNTKQQLIITQQTHQHKINETRNLATGALGGATLGGGTMTAILLYTSLRKVLAQKRQQRIEQQRLEAEIRKREQRNQARRFVKWFRKLNESPQTKRSPNPPLVINSVPSKPTNHYYAPPRIRETKNTPPAPEIKRPEVAQRTVSAHATLGLKHGDARSIVKRALGEELTLIPREGKLSHGPLKEWPRAEGRRKPMRLTKVVYDILRGSEKFWSENRIIIPFRVVEEIAKDNSVPPTLAVLKITSEAEDAIITGLPAYVRTEVEGLKAKFLRR